MRNKYRDWARCIGEICREIDVDENTMSIYALKHIADELEKEAKEKDKTDEIIRQHLKVSP